MVNKTLIPWVKNPDGSQGYTWNPITGCLNHTNELCNGGGFPCYAYRLANGRLRSRYLANWNFAPITMGMAGMKIEPSKDPFYPRFWEDRLGQPQSLGGGMFGLATIPKGIFTCDMSDLFGIGIPQGWTEQVMAVIEACPQHRFYLLTKQPQNLPRWSPFPDNCRVGVTATNKEMLSRAEHQIVNIKAKVKFVSIEPLLSDMGLWYEHPLNDLGQFDQVIIGSQTKPYRPPIIEAVEEIVRACDKAGVPVFIKNNLKPVMRNSAWRIRQEMPTTNV